MKPTYPIYPNVLFKTTEKIDGSIKYSLLSFATTLRIKHEGKYYFQYHKRTHLVETEHLCWMQGNFLIECYQQVYKQMIFGVIRPDFIGTDGEPYNPPDDNQQTEAERMG